MPVAASTSSFRPHGSLTCVCREHEIEPGDKISKKPFKRYTASSGLRLAKAAVWSRLERLDLKPLARAD